MSDDEAPRTRAVYHKKRINRKTKKHIVFDPEARKEFLTGFRKRKLERKKKAEEELQQQLKDERKRIKQEAKETFKKVVKSRQPAPFEDLPTHNYDLENHSISIIELSAAHLAEKNNWIGPNQVQYEDENSENTTKGEKEEEEPLGMELNTVHELRKSIKKKATEEVKKSKAFQLKNKIEQQKSRKKSRQRKRRNIKMRIKTEKRRGKFRG